MGTGPDATADGVAILWAMQGAVGFTCVRGGYSEFEQRNDMLMSVIEGSFQLLLKKY